MKAFVMKEIGNVGFLEKSIPEAGPYDAIVKTNVALVCTSDSNTVHGAIGQRSNLTLGHEAMGTVYKVGSHVKIFKPGDSVSRCHNSRLERRCFTRRSSIPIWTTAGRMEIF